MHTAHLFAGARVLGAQRVLPWCLKSKVPLLTAKLGGVSRNAACHSWWLLPTGLSLCAGEKVSLLQWLCSGKPCAQVTAAATWSQSWEMQQVPGSVQAEPHAPALLESSPSVLIVSAQAHLSTRDYTQQHFS